MVKHLGALVAIAVLVFGSIFLLTSDLPFGGPAQEAPTSGEAIMPAAESPMPEEEAAPAQVAEAAPAEGEAAAAPAEEPAETAPAEGEPPDEAAAEETAAAAPAAGDEATPAGDEAAAPAAAEADTAEEPAAQSAAAAEPAAQSAAPEPAAEETAEAAPADDAAAGADVAALAAAGEETYGQLCQACHGAEGEGAIGPAFAANANLEDAQYVAETIIHGREAMPPFGDQLDDEQIAGVATFIRNSWGNAFGAVTADEVAAAR